MSGEKNNEPCDLVEAKRSEIEQNSKNLEKSLANNTWGYSDLGAEAKKMAMTMLATKTGMYARIPLVCKADSCPYKDSCQLLSYNLAPQGEYCAVETAQIELRYAGYNVDFDIDNASFTDKNLISELINLDVMIERCKALIAKEGVPVVDVVAGIAENGEEFYRPEVSKYWEAYERTIKRRNEIYNLMMATRKDKKKDAAEEASTIDIIQAAIEANSFVIDEKPDEID